MIKQERVAQKWISIFCKITEVATVASADALWASEAQKRATEGALKATVASGQLKEH